MTAALVSGPGRGAGLRAAGLGVRRSAGSGPRAGTRYRRYNPADVRDAHMIHMLRQSRYPFPQIRPILDGLRRTGSSDGLRAALAQRQAGLTQRATAMLDASSHLHHYVTAAE